MNRFAATLALVAVALAQPAYGNCRCEGCAGCAAEKTARDAAGNVAPCCTTTASTRTCCGERSAGAEQAPCPSCSDSGDGCACGISSQPPVAVVAASAAVHHSAILFAAPPATALVEHSPAPLAPLDLDRSVRYGGLRVHAFLGVWVI